ncbi:MAG: hypothetical protein Q4P18_01590 [Methanobrevibacter sp.]|uniref:hypothetical protein n=1 Tax=Methanobrevibacter sp. TaxID=66852 RepID=UPI0026DEE0B4|nr:hypothetical protein [Methanobrevibacter sp.]MDO5848209.1 hypothetical protein [Methanobrevibacter sp.]
MAKKESDFDKKFKRLSRKNDLDVFKSNMGFEAELKNLDNEIENISKAKIKDFDIEKEPLSEYLSIDGNSDFVERCRKKLDSL